MNEFLQLMRFGFLQRALLSGLFIAIACGLLGVFLVLRKQAMMGDGLAHCSFGAVGLALWMGWAPLAVALPVASLASLFVFLLPERSGAFADAAIGMVSATGVAVGVLLASLGGGFNVDLFSFLFGDLLAVGPTESLFALALAGALVVAVTVAYPELFAISYDETAARVAGIRPARWRRLMAMLTAIVVVLGIRVVGTLLVSSLLIFPAATALNLRRSFRGVLVLAPIIGALAVLGGIILTMTTDAPAGASAVLLNGLLFAGSGWARRLRRR